MFTSLNVAVAIRPCIKGCHVTLRLCFCHVSKAILTSSRDGSSPEFGTDWRLVTSDESRFHTIHTAITESAAREFSHSTSSVPRPRFLPANSAPICSFSLVSDGDGRIGRRGELRGEKRGRGGWEEVRRNPWTSTVPVRTATSRHPSNKSRWRAEKRHANARETEPMIQYLHRHSTAPRSSLPSSPARSSQPHA